MARDDELGDTLEARMDEVLEQAGTLPRDLHATIEPARKSGDSAGKRALDALGKLGAQLAPERGVVLHGTIGEGGMGIVRLGTQLALGRPVAVKTVREEMRSTGATLKLLREAWVTGSLEHPNVVPVYDIGLDEHGDPQIVLKKIDGASWAALLGDARTVQRRFHATDLLEWNLGILEQVAQAVHFAHSRGILHRDLKPENVMIGEFGEVYLVDWGIAVSTRDDGSGRLPLAKDATELAGTPCYMAPEMLGGKDVRLTERTDVYLLGAILYELIAGCPPHQGDTFMEMVRKVAASEPELPAHVPAELSRIVRRAMDCDPDARFESAEQFRLAIVGYLTHRGSLMLSADALERLDELEAERAAPSDDPDGQRLRLYHLFGECRFGFRQALRQWAQNDEARVGLRRALEQMIDFELASGEPKAAALLLAEITDAEPALVARVEAAKLAREQEEREFARIRADNDPEIGRRTRAFLGAIFGTLWTAGPLVRYAIEKYALHTYTHRTMVVLSLVLAAIAAALGFWARDSLSRTAINRRIALSVAMSIGAQTLLYLGAEHAGMSVDATNMIALLLWGVVASGAAISVEKRLWVTAAGFFAGFLVVSFFPFAAPFAMSLGNFILTLNVVFIWAQLDDDVVVRLQQRHLARRQRWERFLERTRTRLER